MNPMEPLACTRREMLRTLGGGVGTLGLAALLAPTAGAAPGGAALQAEGEAASSTCS